MKPHTPVRFLSSLDRLGAASRNHNGHLPTLVALVSCVVFAAVNFCCDELRRIALDRVVLRRAVSGCIALRCIALRYVVSCCGVLRCVVLY